MRYPDWKCDAQTVLREARLVIQEFAATHPSETCSFLAFGVNYYEGWVSINFDTPSNSIKRARRRAFRVRQSQQMLLDREDGWKDARYYLTRERMSGINMEIASFQYSSYKVLSFDQWVDYFAALPEAEDHSGHILMLLRMDNASWSFF